MNVLTEAQLQDLSAEIDKQLIELNAINDSEVLQKATRSNTKKLPKKQQAALEQATQQNADSFLKQFMAVAKKDLCSEDGLLYKQWQKWGDLDNESLLKSLAPVLATMGLEHAPLQAALVALVVIILHLGIKTICSDCV
ncbi:MAG: hypothetical protein WAX77_08235 [Methylococcaceae bacterium]